ncbi:STAS domain-containing protein [Poriferisphaera sp. WC338]|uniref:STAS domain-containing protein n=1 Tax=Poriferisphaera sp. WC338 TaxID=3425129 RepID=UPI003D816FEF
MSERVALPEASRLTVSEDRGGYYRIVFPNGKVDGTAVRELYEVTMQLADQIEQLKLLVDLSGIEFMPSGGLGMLVTLRKKFLGSGGQLHIYVPDAQVREVFMVTNLDRLLNLYSNGDEASTSFK